MIFRLIKNLNENLISGITSDLFQLETNMYDYDQLIKNYDEPPYKMPEGGYVQAEIDIVSPREYFEYCAKMFGKTFDYFYKWKVEDEGYKVNLLIDLLNSGTKLYMPMIDFTERRQEGLHRAAAAAEIKGWDTKCVPVLFLDHANTKSKDPKEREKYINTLFSTEFNKLAEVSRVPIYQNKTNKNIYAIYYGWSDDIFYIKKDEWNSDLYDEDWQDVSISNLGEIIKKEDFANVIDYFINTLDINISSYITEVVKKYSNIRKLDSIISENMPNRNTLILDQKIFDLISAIDNADDNFEEPLTKIETVYVQLKSYYNLNNKKVIPNYLFEERIFPDLRELIFNNTEYDLNSNFNNNYYPSLEKIILGDNIEFSGKLEYSILLCTNGRGLLNIEVNKNSNTYKNIIKFYNNWSKENHIDIDQEMQEYFEEDFGIKFIIK